MKKVSIFFLCLLAGFHRLPAQYSSVEIRHATGHGPYPLSITVQKSFCGGKNLFLPFVEAFDRQFGTDHNKALNGFAGSIEMALFGKHFLRFGQFKGLDTRGITLGLGYRYLYRNLNNPDHERFHLQEEVISFDVGYRLNLLYPLTVEFQAGPVLYGFYTITQYEDQGLPDGKQTLEKRFRFGNGIFERNADKKGISGLEFKARIKLFDPAGTEGGIGGFLEWGYVNTFRSRDLSIIHDFFLNDPVQDIRTWDYQYFSLGLVLPLAIRMVSK